MRVLVVQLWHQLWLLLVTILVVAPIKPASLRPEALAADNSNELWSHYYHLLRNLTSRMVQRRALRSWPETVDCKWTSPEYVINRVFMSQFCFTGSKDHFCRKAAMPSLQKSASGRQMLVLEPPQCYVFLRTLLQHQSWGGGGGSGSMEFTNGLFYYLTVHPYRWQ